MITCQITPPTLPPPQVFQHLIPQGTWYHNYSLNLAHLMTLRQLINEVQAVNYANEPKISKFVTQLLKHVNCILVVENILSSNKYICINKNNAISRKLTR